MISNFIKSSLRNFSFNKIYTLINVSGLTLGFSVFALAGLYVIHESTYDKYHKNAGRIYRIVTDGNNYRGFSKFAVTPAPLAPALKSEFAEVEAYSRMSSTNKVRIDYRSSAYFEEGWAYTDPEFFKMFSYEFIEGNPVTALNSPASVVLTESMALKIFGLGKILGEEINLRSRRELGTFTVSGVVKDPPENSVFEWSIITPFEATLKTLGSENLESWGNSNYHTFVMLGDKANVENLASKMPYFRDKHTNDKLSREGGQRSHYLLQPLKEIHYDTDVAFDLKPAMSSTNLLIISSVAILILCLAGINYVNLTSARSIVRAKEIGVRKVVGAYRTSLIFQFLSESVLISVIGFLLAIGVTWVVLPYFNNFTGKEVTLNGELTSLLFLAALLFGVLSGIYPAYIMSRYTPAKVLKGRLVNSKEGTAFRDGLVILQFFASAALIIVAWVIREQLVFVQTQDPGYRTSQVMIVNWNDPAISKYREGLKTEIQRVAGVEGVALSSHLPNRITQSQTRNWRLMGEERQVTFFTGFIDSDFIPLLDMELIQGRNISETETTPQKKYILNETAVKELGLQDPVGMRIIEGESDTLEIIGVIKDFHYASFHEPIKPARLCYGSYVSKVMVKFNPANLEEIIWKVEQIARNFAPDFQFEYDFLDDQFMKAYTSERNALTMVNALTTIALFISCLGLFGLITFTINQKFREIGIRKVFGAGQRNLIFLLVNKLNLMVLISFIMAVPVTYLFLENWLASFAYRITIPLSVYLFSLFVLLFFAWISVGVKTIQASKLNPVDALRHE